MQQDQASNTPNQLPADFLERLAAADVVILIGSSESQDQELTVQTILAGTEFDPERILSHAYTLAVQLEHDNLMQTVRGKPTDAARFGALRMFAGLAGSDKARFDVINVALQMFEEENGLADEATNRTDEDFNKIADFVLQMVIETAPVLVAPTTEPETEVTAPKIILAH